MITENPLVVHCRKHGFDPWWGNRDPLCCMLCYAKSLQSCPTLCDPIDGSPPGSLLPGILQARTLEWVAISFSRAWKWKVKVKSLTRVPLFETPWTAAHQAPPPTGFSRQEYWSGVPLPSPSTHYKVIIIKIVWYRHKERWRQHTIKSRKSTHLW